MVASAIANKVSVQCSELIRGHSNSAHPGLGEGGSSKCVHGGGGPTVQFSNLADFYIYLTSISLSKILTLVYRS